MDWIPLPPEIPVLSVPPLGEAYISLAEVEAKATAYELPLPDPLILADQLATIEISIDQWLGYRYALQNYTADVLSNHFAQVGFPVHPVVKIYQLLVFVYEDPNRLSAGVPPYKPATYYQAGRFVEVDFTEYPYRVWWAGGHATIPQEFKIAAWSLIRGAIENGITDMTDLLYSPTADKTSLSIPGGLSKSVRLGQASSAKPQMGAGDGTVLDRVLTAYLGRYRQSVFVPHRTLIY